MNDVILIVEDDLDIAELIRVNLEDMSLKTVHQANGKLALETALKDDFALIILDLMLPEVSGLDICRIVREKNLFRQS